MRRARARRRAANRATSLAWAKNNPEKHLAKDQRYKSRKLDQFIEDVDRLVLADRDSWICGICCAIINQELSWPDPGSLSVDHTLPLSKGGEHSYSNTQAAHLVCNISKGNR